MKDPYDLLGVSRQATPEEIRQAFRKLASKHHPDKNPTDPDAAQRFKEINAAHQILSDPKKRAMFDRFGAAGVGEGGAGARGPFGGGIDFSELHLDSIFGDLLEALGVRVGERGDVQRELVVSFEEAAFGCTKPVSYERIVLCDTCGGRGAAHQTDLQPCTACGGRGKVRYQQGLFPLPVERTCSRCQGSGRIVTTPCGSCRGAGLISRSHSVDVAIPAGVEGGTTRRLEGLGNRLRGKARCGDLEVTIQVKPHEFFRRSGDHVLCAIPITFSQAALGDEVEVPTLDGRALLRVPAGTQPGTILRMRGKGVPRRVVGGRGDQLVEVQVEVPTELSEKQRLLLEELAKELGESVQPQRRTFLDKLKALFD